MIADITSFGFMKCHQSDEIGQTICALNNKWEINIFSVVPQGSQPAFELHVGVNIRIEKVTGDLCAIFSQDRERINGAGPTTDM
jgi:hypothetical protein